MMYTFAALKFKNNTFLAGDICPIGCLEGSIAPLSCITNNVSRDREYLEISWVLGPVSQMIDELIIQILCKIYFTLFFMWLSDEVTHLYMPWQLCCHGMCKIVVRLGHQFGCNSSMFLTRFGLWAHKWFGKLIPGPCGWVAHSQGSAGWVGPLGYIDYFTVSLHSPNHRHFPTVQVMQGDSQSLSPQCIAVYPQFSADDESPICIWQIHSYSCQHYPMDTWCTNVIIMSKQHWNIVWR